MISGAGLTINGNDESSSDLFLDVETTTPISNSPMMSINPMVPFNIPYIVTTNKRNPRGTRRGRPRGSRRGGGTGSKGRDSLQPTPVTSTITSSTTMPPVYNSREDRSESRFNNASFTVTSPIQEHSEDLTHTKMTPPIRRGPGRPRLKPVGPGNQGTRGTSRPRKAARPLPVPLRAQVFPSAAVTPTPMTDTLHHHNVQFQPNCFNFYGSVAPPPPTV